MSVQIRKDLFDLIKSMSMSEKRHFKIFASKHVIGKRNYYVALFDAMDKMKTYNEDEIKQTQNYTQKISLLKNRLYHAIIKSLDAYYHSHSVDAQLLGYIHSIEILFNRALFTQGEKMLKKALALAHKYNKDALMLVLLDWQLKYISLKGYAGMTEKDITLFFNRIQQTAKRYINYIQYNELNAELFFRIKQSGAIRDKQSNKVFEKVIRHPLLQSPEKALSLQSLYNYHKILNAYYFMTDNHQKAYESIYKLYSLFNQHPHLKEEDRQQYKAVLTNLVSCEIDIKKYQDALVHIQEIRSLKISGGLWEVERFYSTAMFELGIYLLQCNFSGALGFVEKNKEEIFNTAAHASANEAKIILQYLSAYTYFANEKYSRSLRTINGLLNLSDKNNRSDVIGFARILLLIICYEKKDEELMEYAFKSVYRYLSKKGRLYKVESVILNFVRKMPKLTSNKLLKEAFKKLKEEIQLLLNDPMEKRVLTYFDFISWLDSKIENISFAKAAYRNMKK